MQKLSAILIISLWMISCKKANDTTEQMIKEATTYNKPFPGVDFALNYDPVCKMSLSLGTTDSATYNNKVYGFCRSACKNEFIRNPNKFLK